MKNKFNTDNTIHDNGEERINKSKYKVNISKNRKKFDGGEYVDYTEID